MSISTFRPYGLIINQPMEALYLSCRVTLDLSGNIVDPKQANSVQLFQYLFTNVLFPNTIDFMCFAQEPPHIRSIMACELVIKYVTYENPWRVFCFAEAKRAYSTSNSTIVQVEKQAKDYCLEYMNANPKIELTYACTLVGTSLRCWSMRREEAELMPFWGNSEESKYEHYLDIGLDENRDEILKAFGYMKTF